MTNENKTVAQLLEGVEVDAWLRVSNISGLSTRASLSDSVELASESIFPLRRDTTFERVFGPVVAEFNTYRKFHSAYADTSVLREKELEAQCANLSRAVAELTETKDAAYLSGVGVGEARRAKKLAEELAEGVLALSHPMDCECEWCSGKNPLQELADESQRLGLYDVQQLGWPVGKVHELKCWTSYFGAVYSGIKSFEVRFNDRDFRKGDLLLLREWNVERKDYTGRMCERLITYVLTASEFCKEGFAILSLCPLDCYIQRADAAKKESGE
ncbi:MAG: PUA-like protein [Rhodocyclales bacterium]|nr:PUA-like protein [Rhodocyclales bacterium]